MARLRVSSHRKTGQAMNREEYVPIMTPTVNAMMIVGIFVSAIAFAYKIAEFLFAINAEEAQGFADVPVTAYFFVAAGWIFILYWSFRSGQLRDAEKVKYDMLRQEEAYERAGQ